MTGHLQKCGGVQASKQDVHSAALRLLGSILKPQRDLIIIPGDASFTRVTESSSGRVFVLKFESSDQKHFVRIQYEDLDLDSSQSVLEQVEQNVNGLLQDPEFRPSWDTSPSTDFCSLPGATASNSALNATESTALNNPSTSRGALDNSALSQSIVDQLRAMMANRMAGVNPALQEMQPSTALSDILSPSSLSPLFEPSNSHVLAPLQEFLPPDLPKETSSTPQETLRRVIQSGPFQSSVRQLDRAFATGLLGRLMPGFGLPEEAGINLEEFLKAIYEKAKREHEDTTKQ
ncbi:11872_t:CDS:2, partial [Acaulospora colombiana]